MMSLIKKLVSRVEMMLAKAVIKAVEDTNEIQLVKLSVLADETQDGMERLQNYGMSSNPPVGSEAFIAYLNGNRDHGVVLVCDNGEFRPVGLKNGEVIFYSKFGHSLLFKDNGEYVFGEGEDFAVAFNNLKIGFDQLKLFVNTLVLPVSGDVAGPPSTPTPASIDGAKVSVMRLP